MKRRRTPAPDPGDSADFAEAMRGVRPRAPDNRAPAHRRPPPPEPRQAEADARAVLRESMEGPLDGPLAGTGDELCWRGPGLQDGKFRKLRRGAFRAERELDLHGMRSEEAREALAGFLDAAAADGAQCVRVIHGKGLRSKGQGPVLKQRVDGWLRRRRDVLAFCSARPADGGTGAVVVLLKRR